MTTPRVRRAPLGVRVARTSFTVVLRTPPPQVLRKWVLATDNGRSHLIPMPGVTADIVNAFLDDMTTETGNSP